MPTNYQIQIDEDELILLDETGQEVDYEVADSLIKRLTRSYSSNRKTTIYVMYSPIMNLHKIGITSNPISQRRNNLRQQYDDPDINIVREIPCRNRREAMIKEKLLHELFNHLNVASSPINGRGLGREWFRLSDNDVSFMMSQCLFLPLEDSFTFHPMAFMRYVLDNTFYDRQIRQILVHTSEIWAQYQPRSHMSTSPNATYPDNGNSNPE